jgi:hypothetical protein
MRIIAIKYPIIDLELSNSEKLSLDVAIFLNKIMPDEHSPYKKILEPDIFPKAFILRDKLVWDGVLEIMMCGGDTMWLPAEFSEAELKKGILVR